ncbi:zinc finger protein 431-like [Zerene cesonia]|uniref:zinc finger protein 431-like n=1 Tax=Zerene cesonia TaxID=33412 RepID=UPI0018E5183A|nr:zinc finger protein 431-like [Zerene cesonia]
MNVFHEREIKIEYIEDVSFDPLADNCENTTKKTKKKIESGKDDFAVDYINKNTVNYACSVEDNVINWYKEIDNNGRYLCKYCDLNYSTTQTLRYHIRTKHYSEAKELKTLISNNKRRSKIKCHICEEKFQCVNDLKVHFDTCHKTAYLYKSCLYCDATFSTEFELAEHQLNIHQTIKKARYMCSICGYRTAKKSHYNQHQNTHLSIKGTKCKYCDYTTHYSPNLKIHERIHSNTKPYKCDYGNCTYSCAAKSALRSHKLKHNPDENMLYCDKCSYKTVYKQTLKKHQDSHNRNSIGIRIV